MIEHCGWLVGYSIGCVSILLLLPEVYIMSNSLQIDSFS